MIRCNARLERVRTAVHRPEAPSGRLMDSSDGDKAAMSKTKEGGKLASRGFHVVGRPVSWWTDLPTKPTKGGLICRQSQLRVD